MSTEKFWDILKIEPTKAEEAIRAAYMAELPNFHPEDDPQGFQNLRAAYESAVAYARASEEGEEPEDTTPSGLIVKELCLLLDDFVRVIDPAEWEKILNPDDCPGIDLQSQVGNKLLVVLMDGQYVPQKVWKLLDAFFGWQVQADHLKEEFPAGYIDYVLNSVHYRENIRDEFFDLSDPNADFVGLIEKFYELRRVIANGELDEAEKMIAENDGPLFRHLDYRILVIRYYNFREENEKAEAMIRALNEEYPDDIPVLVGLANILARNEKSGEALPIFEKILKEVPNHYDARVGEARCYLDLGEYEKAKEKCLAMLIGEYRFDSYVSSIFHASSERLIEIYEAQLSENPSDQDIIYKLASCYFNEDQIDKSIELIKNNVPDDSHVAKHNELYFDAALEMSENPEEEAEELVAYIYAWEKHEKDRLRLRFLPQKFYSIGRYDEALEKAEFYLNEFPDDPEICLIKAQIYHMREMGTEAHKAIDAGLKTEPEHLTLLEEQAKLCYEEGNIADAVTSAEAVIAIYPYAFDMREMVVEIYYHAEQMETVLEMAADAEHYELESDDILMYKAAAQIALNQDLEDAEERLIALREKHEENVFVLEELGNFYNNRGQYEKAADVYSDLIRLNPHPYYYLSRGWARHSDRGILSLEFALEDAETALELDPEYVPAYYQKGFIYFCADALSEAAECLSKALAIDPKFRSALICLIRVFSELGQVDAAIAAVDTGIENFADDAESVALLQEEKLGLYYNNNMYREALSLEPFVLGTERLKTEDLSDEETSDGENADVYKNLAYSHYEIGDNETAERYYRKALELEPEDSNIWRSYAHFKVFGTKDRQGAIEAYLKSLEIQQYYATDVQLAKAYADTGQNSAAKKHYKNAIKQIEALLNISAKPCYEYYLGECYFGLKKYKEAEKHLLKALETAPEYESCNKHFCYEASFVLAELYRLRGETAKAKEYFEMTVNTVPDREYAEQRDKFE